MGKLGWRVRMGKWGICTRGVVREAGRILGTAGDRVRGGSSGDRYDVDDDGHHGEGCPGDKLIVQM